MEHKFSITIDKVHFVKRTFSIDLIKSLLFIHKKKELLESRENFRRIVDESQFRQMTVIKINRDLRRTEKLKSGTDEDRKEKSCADLNEDEDYKKV